MVTPLTGMFDVADTTVVPGVAELIVTVQLAIEAVAGCGPASIVPPRAFTVIVSTWFVPTGLFAVAGVIWMLAFTNVLTASPEFGATPFVCTVTVWPPTVSVDDA